MPEDDSPLFAERDFEFVVTGREMPDPHHGSDFIPE
jgi:hypothetical protein